MNDSRAFAAEAEARESRQRHLLDATMPKPHRAHSTTVWPRDNGYRAIAPPSTWISEPVI